MNPASGPGWADVAVLPTSPADADAYLHPDHYRAFDVTTADLRAALAAAPTEAAALAGAKPVDLVLPAPDGTEQHFRVTQVPVLAPELAAKFPEIQTFEGAGVDDPTARLRMDVSPLGFHAQVRSAAGGWYIDPYYFRETEAHISYFRSDLGPEDVYAGKGPDPARPKEAAPIRFNELEPLSSNTLPPAMGPFPNAQDARSGTQLRTYRLAVAATGEYTALAGGTQGAALAAITNVVNRISGVYEDELSIRLVLIGNELPILFTDPNADPYNNASVFAMLTQNQTTIDSLIGSGNYDIGHVFSTSGQGGIVGQIGSVGQAPVKAQGATGAVGAAVGDDFAIDFVAHEMGHQFGGHHSFNSLNVDTAVDPPHNLEPGSGSTIMSYAGVTGPDSDLQPHSDAMFNSGSFDDIITYVDTVIPGVGIRTPTNNLVPTVNAGPDYVIPAATPFVLTAASASDGNGDPLTYSWEERDGGASPSLLSSPDDGFIPLFRVFNPTTDPSRTFPRLTDLVNNVNTAPLGERLPTASRDPMRFRVTVRDNRNGGGGVNTDDMQVQVVNTAAPFAVTAPNTAETWVVGEQQDVTWDVAGTTAAPISAANVKITLSLDGGFTYPIVLAASVPNTGSATITVPNNLTSQARVRVQPVNGIFFDISNTNFNIAATAPTYQVSGKVYEDFAGNGVRDAYDRGVGGQTVLFDTNGNGLLDSGTFASGTVNIPILDNFPPGSTSSINVSGLPTSLLDVNVNFTINHTWCSDLYAELRGPNNVSILLVAHRGGQGQSFQNTTFDDEAATPISSGTGNFSGSFVPEQSLSTFDGINPNGTWTLHVVDNIGGDSGTLVRWSLTMPTETTATTAGSGSYGVNGLADGTYEVRPLLTGYNPVAPVAGFQTVTVSGPSDTHPNTDFGVGRQNAIYGVVFADGNSNSVFDAGEPGIPNQQVYQDTNNSGGFNPGEPTLTTDGQGRYVFTDQPSGPVIIRDVLTGAQIQSLPAGGAYSVNLAADATLVGLNFGVVVGSPPTITSDGGGAAAAVNVEEGFTAVTTVTATDPDLDTTLSYNIVGGADATQFTIDPATGVLAFLAGHFLATPTDANGDSVYLVTVRVSDGILADQQAFSVTITPAVNHAPVLDNGGSPALTPVPQGMPSPAGDAVASVLGTSVSDLNFDAVEGMAVVGLSDTADGSWQYSLDAGTTWVPFGAVGEGAALVLRPEDRVRFVPDAGFVHVVTVTFRAWDQTTGQPGDTVDLTAAGATGGATAYSTATETASLRVAQTLAAAVEDSTKHAGDATGALVANFVADPDANAKRGIAVTGVSGPTAGVWQYSPNGRLGWKNIPAVSTAGALLLKDTDHVRFLPAADQAGYAMINYRAWDQSVGKRGALADLTGPNGTGGASAFSAAGDVAFAVTTPANDRPLLDAGGVTRLTTVTPGDANPPGDTVANLIGTTVVDVDPNAVHGIAITAVGKTRAPGGSWEFSTDAGATWLPFPAVTVKAALLLRPDDLVRFRPNVGFTGPASFSFKAWDQTEGTFGTAVADTTSKVVTAYSAAAESAVVQVDPAAAPANHAPVLSAPPFPLTVTVVEDTRPRGDAVSDLAVLELTAADADPAALKGIAVTGVTGLDHGRWEWSLAGGGWKPIAPASDASALLLRPTDRVRYVPNRNDETGGGTLSFRAWDETRGSAGHRADLTVPNGTGGASAFSTAVDSTAVVLLAQNDAPVLRTSGFPVLPPPESPTPAGVPVSGFADALITDPDAGALKGIAVVKAVAAFGAWEFSTTGGGSWTPFPAVSGARALLLQPTDWVRVSPTAGAAGLATLGFRAWDQTVGTAGVQFPTAGSAFSKALETATMASGVGNARPMMDASGNPVVTHPAGSTVASLLGTSVTDPNLTDPTGIAVTAAVSSPTRGTWEYSLDNGTTWLAMGKVSAGSALLLRSTDLVRFVPAAGYLGTQKLSFKAWDQTEGTAGQKLRTTTFAFSKETETATVNVNTAPTLTL